VVSSCRAERLFQQVGPERSGPVECTTVEAGEDGAGPVELGLAHRQRVLEFEQHDIGQAGIPQGTELRRAGGDHFAEGRRPGPQCRACAGTGREPSNETAAVNVGRSSSGRSIRPLSCVARVLASP
jgi:hypothetical protein